MSLRKDNQYRDYLGDGVYVYFDGYHIWLHVEGNTVDIALGPEVLQAFDGYRKRLVATIAEEILNEVPGTHRGEEITPS